MNFKGELPSSKSLVNRYLVLKQGFPELDLKWSGKALDILLLKKALSEYQNKEVLSVGEGGTTLRFLALYLSTQKGKWALEGAPSLFKRPQKGLLKALEDLGVQTQTKESTLLIESQGWKKNALTVSLEKTTQVLTGVLLAALSSHQEIEVSIRDPKEQSGYFSLTQNFLDSLGFKFLKEDNKIYVPGAQKSKETELRHIETDWSSAAFIYVLAALMGRARVYGVFKKSIQPDAVVLEVLEKSGVDVQALTVRKNKISSYTPVNVNLKNSPDLFPVLAAFSCFCRGESSLYGAPQLVYKESNRIELIYRLLVQCGYKVSRLEDGLRIKGEGFKIKDHKPFTFDVSTDHRIFMAAEIMRLQGYNIDIKGQESLNKSFPEYFELEW